MCVGITLWFGWGGVVSVCRLKLHTDTTPPQPSHNVTITHIEPEQYNQRNNSTNKSQSPEDGCINIQNMLSSKQWNNKASDIKLVSLYSTIKMMHGPINIRKKLYIVASCWTIIGIYFNNSFKKLWNNIIWIRFACPKRRTDKRCPKYFDDCVEAVRDDCVEAVRDLTLLPRSAW